MKIVIIQHENDFEAESGVYFIEIIAKCWRDNGHEVVFVNGVNLDIQADLALLHVNLSVVPEKYVEYAKQFPIVWNLGVTDIRKQAISQNLIVRSSSYPGPVIVKTDLNSAGYPEYMLLKKKIPYLKTSKNYWRSFARNSEKVLKKLYVMDKEKSSLKNSVYRGTFRVFKSKHNVPNYVWDSEDWVVEKFLPETDQSSYVIRNAHFLGSKMVCFKNYSKDPIVKDEEEEGTSEVVVTNKRIIQFRDESGLDYGKIDYVMYNDEPVILDVAKTMGGTFGFEAAKLLAPGLYDYILSENKLA